MKELINMRSSKIQITLTTISSKTTACSNSLIMNATSVKCPTLEV